MSRLIASLLLTLAGAVSTPAQADEIAYDPAPLQQCIVHGGADAARLEACKGAGANPCIRAEGDSTIATTLCWDREGGTWREIMDTIVARLASRATSHAAALHASQAAWTRWVEAECGYRADLYEGGSGAQVELATCAANLTADRVISLLHTEALL